MQLSNSSPTSQTMGSTYNSVNFGNQEAVNVKNIIIYCFVEFNKKINSFEAHQQSDCA